MPTRQLFCASYSDVFLHNISFMCFARYLTKMLRSFACVYDFFLVVDNGEIIFSQKEMFSVGDLALYSNKYFALRSGFAHFRVCCDKALCFFFMFENRVEKKKFSEA